MGGQCQSFATNIGTNRQFPVADIKQHCQADGRRAAKIEQFIHGCTYGAAGHQHIIHQQNVLAIHIKGQLGGGDCGFQAPCIEVVPVEGWIQGAHGQRLGQFVVQCGGDPGAAGFDAYQQRAAAVKVGINGCGHAAEVCL